MSSQSTSCFLSYRADCWNRTNDTRIPKLDCCKNLIQDSIFTVPYHWAKSANGESGTRTHDLLRHPANNIAVRAYARLMIVALPAELSLLLLNNIILSYFIIYLNNKISCELIVRNSFAFLVYSLFVLQMTLVLPLLNWDQRIKFLSEDLFHLPLHTSIRCDSAPHLFS